MLRLPDNEKEYLAIYTTEYDDSYIFEPIVKYDLSNIKKYFIGMNERVFEEQKETNLTDPDATIEEKTQIANSIRNRAEEIVLHEMIYKEDAVWESLKNFGAATSKQ